MKIHILGISGTFMSGIAILAKQLGHQVTGSDLECYEPMKSVLSDSEITVIKGYKINQIKNKDLIIIGNVMSRGNPVIEYILANKLNYTSGPQWLYENILKNKKVIAVSGTHGKTTTTSMIVHILKKNSLNVSYLIGGNPNGLKRPANLTRSKYFVIEADEYDTAFFDKQSKFIHYKPDLLLINNIEFDHADIFNNLDNILKSFHHLIRCIPSSGKIIINYNDKNIRKLLSMGYWSKVIQVDKRKSSMYNLHKKKDNYYFIKNSKSYLLPSNIMGEYNFMNACMAITACNHLKIPITKQIKSLETYKGVKRRMESRGQADGIKIFDDFAHHPTAIQSAIRAIKEIDKRKKLLTICIPSSNSMLMGAHDNTLLPALKESDYVLLISKSKNIKNKFNKNTKINVIETHKEISNYLPKMKTIETILILSNKNTDEIIKSLKNE